jgi:hypothetical protein
VGKWAIYADWRNLDRVERAWWIVDGRYPEGALSQGAVIPKIFKTKDEAVQEAVKVALKVSEWAGGYDISVLNVSGKLSPLGILFGKIGGGPND